MPDSTPRESACRCVQLAAGQAGANQDQIRLRGLTCAIKILRADNVYLAAGPLCVVCCRSTWLVACEC